MNSKIVRKTISILCAVAMSASPIGASINVFAAGSSTSALNITNDQIKNMCRYTLENEIKQLNLELNYVVDKEVLNNNRSTDELSKKIKYSNQKITEVANRLENNDYFKALKDKILSKEIDSNQFFQEINNRIGIHPRAKVAITMALDDWMANNQITHTTNIINSIYFVDAKYGNIIWPNNDGYRGNARLNYINELVVGAEIDRFGHEYGTYTCLVKNGRIYQFNERSLPNKENLNTFHRYKVIKDFSKLKEVVSDLRLNNIPILEKNAMDKYDEIKESVNTPEIKNFNYQLLQKLAESKESVAKRGKRDVVHSKCEELHQILQKINDEFQEAKSKTSRTSCKKMIDELSTQEKAGYISLTKISNVNSIEAGEIAPAFKQQGHGTQIVLPCSVSLLKTLEFLANVK